MFSQWQGLKAVRCQEGKECSGQQPHCLLPQCMLPLMPALDCCVCMAVAMPVLAAVWSSFALSLQVFYLNLIAGEEALMPLITPVTVSFKCTLEAVGPCAWDFTGDHTLWGSTVCVPVYL